MTTRKYLTEIEVEKLLFATKGQRHEHRDYALLMLMFRHGLRVSEACGLMLDQVDLESGRLHVHRLKNGLSTTHPLRQQEAKAIRRWLARRPRSVGSHLFLSERGQGLTRQGVAYLVRRYGRLAKLPVGVHAHMLRHACGYALADHGADALLIRDYLGHRNIANTTVYTRTNPARFDRLWR
ncbi:MAG: tyrosine-type recombinase/integrase [Acidobacteria bacterium]|nr:tyrosine-type recombinase/integrase [Acidobacteriota bacterium]